MLEGIDVNQRIEFISSKDITEPKTVFVLRPLSGIERMNLVKQDFSIDKILGTAIVEIRNNKNIPVVEYLNVLGLDVLNELLRKVNEISHIEENLKKN